MYIRNGLPEAGYRLGSIIGILQVGERVTLTEIVKEPDEGHMKVWAKFNRSS